MKQKKVFLVCTLKDGFNADLVNGFIDCLVMVLFSRKDLVTYLSVQTTAAGLPLHVIEVSQSVENGTTFALVDSEYGL